MKCVKRITVLLALLALISGCIKSGEAPDSKDSTGTLKQPESRRIQRPQSLFIHESSAGLYDDWARSGLKGFTLINISPKSGMERGTGLIASAASSGMISGVYWILPYGLFNDIPLAGERVKAFLKGTATEFDSVEVEAMRMELGCLSGRLSGMNMHICSPVTMPRIEGRTALMLDAAFIPPFAYENGASKLYATKILFDSLGSKLPALDRADVVVGVRDGTLKPIHAYLAYQSYDILNSPEILDSLPPELWKLRDNAENMYSGGEGGMVINDVSASLKAYPDDRPLRMIEAAALARTGKTKDALDKTKDLCSEQVDYCYALAFLAAQLEAEGRKKDSAAFLKEAKAALKADDPMKPYRRDPHTGMEALDK